MKAQGTGSKVQGAGHRVQGAGRRRLTAQSQIRSSQSAMAQRPRIIAMASPEQRLRFRHLVDALLARVAVNPANRREARSCLLDSLHFVGR